MKKYLQIMMLTCALSLTKQLHGQTTTIFNNTYNGFTPQAQIAFDFAAHIWSQTIQSTVPIKINAYFVPLIPTLLGITFPNGIKDFPSAPQSGTWYATSLANSIAGTELNPGQFDIDIYLNSSINWYTDTIGAVPAGKFDLVSVALHEICHGLGFISLAKKSGTEGSFGLLQASDFAPFLTSFPWPNLDTLPAVFDKLLVNNFVQPLDTFTNPSAALGTQLTSNNVFFNGSYAISANFGTKPKIYAPATFTLGSSILHLDEATYPVGNLNELMTPLTAPGNSNHNPGPICIGILKDIGWMINPLLPIHENSTFENDFEIYPNPAHHTIQVHMKAMPVDGEIKILNASGIILAKKSIVNERINNNYDLDIHYLLPGIYFLSILTSKNSIYTKLIVE